MPAAENLTPTGHINRINSVDIIRGVALCGMILINIPEFGLPYAHPNVDAIGTGPNLAAWWTNSMFFEGTMRGLFSMLFGAGIILFTGRATEKINGVSVTDAYFRRLLWLFLFGVIHCYVLLWHGEILFSYALVGMFAFSFRYWNPRQLMIGAIVLFSLATGLSVRAYLKEKNAFDRATAAQQKMNDGGTLATDEKAAIEHWQSNVTEKEPSQEKLNEKIEAHHQNYFSIFMYKGPLMCSWKPFSFTASLSWTSSQ